jgi:dolichol-phosphate mannosyltransferase
MMAVTVIVPTKDEPALQDLVDEINKYIKQKHDILIIDKSQVTPSVVGAKVIPQNSDGLGNAFVEAMTYAEGDMIALMDGDGSHRPEDLCNMLSKAEDYDVVLGSKLIEGGISNDVLGRKVVTIALSWLTRLILGVKIKDPMTGFMVAKRDVLENLELRPRGFKVVIEIVYKLRAKTVEVPILFRERRAGSSKVGFNVNGFMQIIEILLLLVELRWGRIRGFW